jgi:predicted glycogen debranching enzyme
MISAVSALPSSIRFGRETCGVLAAAETREWLCTNGAGSFASGTVAGTLTRRYHGLLVAALSPPLGRTLVVAGLTETASYSSGRFELATHRWADGTLAPAGHVLVESFRLDGTTPTWTFALAEALLEKRIFMEQGAATTYVQYRVLRASAPLALELKALVNYRDHHGITRVEGDAWRMRVDATSGGLEVRAFDGARVVRVLSDRAAATSAHEWYRGFRLSAETERGLSDLEDHLHAGTLTAELREGETLTVACSIEDAPSLDGEAAWARRAAHEQALLARWRESGAAGEALAFVPQLVLAADQFVVARPLRDAPDGMSVIAGYPWFGDWGRDTMIALPGLALATGRPDVSRNILATFARFVDRGMIPNHFPDGGQAPEYNTADATLWYVEAIRAHVDVTDDVGLLRELAPVLEDVLRSHVEGTRHGIGVDPADGLLRAGEPGVQLTWMDAKVGDWIVTPRSGKCVELNALWYNALRAMAGFCTRLGLPHRDVDALAERVRASFGRFWNEERRCLFDVIDGPDGNDARLRPNQILAVSLKESPLDVVRQRDVLEVVARELLVSFGLRSLAPAEPEHRGRYEGGPAERDGSYHQGAAWGWLIGPFVEAHLRVHGDRAAARRFLEPFGDHLRDHGLGSIAELFDSDAPHRARGCPAQAWSVAEVLRVAALLG